DGNLARTSIAGFADALFAPALSAVVGSAGEPEIAADLAAVVKGAVEHLVDQLLAADQADALAIHELSDLGGVRAFCRSPQLSGTDAVEFLQLFVNQAQPFVLAHNLLLEPRRQQMSIPRAHLVEAGEEARLHRHDVTDALPLQQSLDAIAVGGAFVTQLVTFAR